MENTVVLAGKHNRNIEINLGAGLLRWSDGTEYQLRPKPAQVLEYLLARHGQLVPKDELFKASWGNEVVVDGALRNAIADVRKSLSYLDVPVIKAIPRRGYVFLLEPRPDAGGEAKSPTSVSKFQWVTIGLMFAAVFAVLGVAKIWNGSSENRGGYPPNDGCLLLLGTRAGPDQAVIEVPDAQLANPAVGDFSISVWINPDSQRGVIFDKREMEPMIRGWALALYEGKLVFQMATGDGQWRNFTDNYNQFTDNTDRWYHVVITVDRNEESGGKMYVNNELRHLFIPVEYGANLSNSASLRIGNRNDGKDPFEGRIAQPEFFGRVLNAAEVSAKYHSVVDRLCQPGRE